MDCFDPQSRFSCAGASSSSSAPSTQSGDRGATGDGPWRSSLTDGPRRRGETGTDAMLLDFLRPT